MKKQPLWLVFISLFILVGANPAFPASDNPGGFTEKDKEHYLTEELLSFIRPGVEFELLDFVVEDDNQPLATFSLKDPGGLPLDLDGIFTPGPVDVRMMLTYIPQGEEQKVSYHDRSTFFRDRNGTYTSLGDGVYTYKFTTVLPDDWDMDATHTLAVVTTRDLQEFDLGRYYDNDVMDYVPSGASEPMPRDIVTTATCNRCHDPLAEHGGRYQEVGVCQQCHNPGNFNEEYNLSYSFDAVIHRVHASTEPQLDAIHYPTDLNDCQVCHTGGTPTADVPMVANPNPTPVCDSGGRGNTVISWGDQGLIDIYLNSPDGQLFASRGKAGSQETGKWVNDSHTFVMVGRESGDVIQELPINTTVFGCVGNAPGTFRGEAASLHTNWMTRPSRAVCGGCHADVDFEGGSNHPQQTDDENCRFCHRPMGEEYDASVAGAHTVEYKSTQLNGVLLQIKDIFDTAPGQRPTVLFSLNDKNGRLDPSVLNRLRFYIVGPNTDYESYVRENAGELTPFGNDWIYTFDWRVPTDAVGSYSVTFESRVLATIDTNEGPDEVRDQAENYVVPFAVTDAEPVARRMVVEDYKCENCHSNLAEHGSNRHNAGQMCQMCHNANAVGETGIESAPEDSVHFKYMIHKIHRGFALENGYVVDETDYGEVHFPGDLRNCESCHAKGTYNLPVVAGALPTVSPNTLINPMPPATAACLSCHDGVSAAIHADSNTSALGEACATCHGVGKTYSVDRVHAR